MIILLEAYSSSRFAHETYICVLNFSSGFSTIIALLWQLYHGNISVSKTCKEEHGRTQCLQQYFVLSFLLCTTVTNAYNILQSECVSLTSLGFVKARRFPKHNHTNNTENVWVSHFITLKLCYLVLLLGFDD